MNRDPCFLSVQTKIEFWWGLHDVTSGSNAVKEGLWLRNTKKKKKKKKSFKIF